MCGIAGILDLGGEPLDDPGVARRMAQTLVHRGPDDAGFFHQGPVAFGFRRLSIIDLSSGHQPLGNENGDVQVMFNGEIYNYRELRKDLAARGHVFRTESDTEAIVHAYEEYGLDFVRTLRGMFAISIWDAPNMRLVLVRDRIGKKPLFYSIQDGQLAFGSEVKALFEWPRLRREISPEALHDYLTFLYVPSPRSILTGVHKLPPAHMLVVECRKEVPGPARYWSIDPKDLGRSERYYVERLKETLSESVLLRLRSDVPLGAFLSGGIDSTVVVGLMRGAVPAGELRTFTIGFPDKRFDESRYAGIVARKVRSVHTSETMDAGTFRPDELRRLVWHMDEPFGDSSFLPTYWVSRLAREHVKVVLSGDGGDELFAGYPRYQHLKRLGWMNRVPRFLRKGGGEVSRILSSRTLLPWPTLREGARRARKAVEISLVPEEDERMLRLLSYYDEDEKARVYAKEWLDRVQNYSSLQTLRLQLPGVRGEMDSASRFMVRDLQSNMVDDSLVKVDRASMACSLEVRSPFLDHRVVECAVDIPILLKARGGKTKLIVKKAFGELIPTALAKRPKSGFEVPFATWFRRSDWRGLLVDTISEERLRKEKVFSPGPVIALRDQMLDNPEAVGLAVSAYQLRHRVWALLMFHLWKDEFHGAN